MTSPEGVTYLADAQINIFCKKAAAVPYGTHTIFIGEAETVNVRDPIEPLIFQGFLPLPRQITDRVIRVNIQDVEVEAVKFVEPHAGVE